VDGYRPTLYLFYVRESVWLIPIHKPFAWLDAMADKHKAQSEIDDWLKNKSHKTQDDLMEEARRFVESKKIIR